METSKFLENFNEHHFIYKLRHREFDKQAGQNFLSEIKKISNSEGEYVSKELISKFVLTVIILHNQIEYFVKELNKKEWEELHTLFNEIYFDILRILN